MIYHVATIEDWEIAQVTKRYIHPSLEKEGFIHACTIEQVPGVLHRYYKDTTEIVLLHIDESKLTCPLKYELAPSVNELFPHCFGSINIDAIVTVESHTELKKWIQ